MIWLFTFILNAHAVVDRTAAVAGAHRLLPIMLDVLQEKMDKRSAAEKLIFKRVRETIAADQTLLVYSREAHYFDLGNEKNRLMMTPKNTLGQIDVNLTLLNADDTWVNLPYLMKLLFHEYARKIGQPIADCDRVAQWLEDETQPFSRKYDRLEVFSVPAAAIDHDLGVGPEVPQPTNLVLLTETDQVREVTRQFHLAILEAMPALRTLWHELNRFTYAMLAFGEAGLRATFDRELERNIHAGKLSRFEAALFAKEFKDHFKIGLNELRVLEIQDIEALADGALRVKASWVTTRSAKKRFTINFEGPSPPLEEFSVPLTLTGTLENLTAIVRPTLDLTQTAKVRNLERGPEGVTIGLEFPEAVPDIHLYVQTKHGLRLLPPLYNGGGLVVFRITPDFENGARVYAEAVQIGTNKTLYLDRLVEAGEGPDTRRFTPNYLAAAGLAYFDDQVEGFRSKFDFSKPIFAAPGLTIDKLPYVDALHVPIAFRLAHPAEVIEVRLHMKRLAITGATTGEEVVFTIPWSEREVQMGIPAGEFSQMPNYFEVITSERDRIRSFPDGSVRTSLVLPFLGPEITKVGDIHMLPAITPIALEVVLEDGQVLSHPLGEWAQPGECALNLEGEVWGSGSANFTIHR